VSPFVDPVGINASGPPACTADLGAQVATCTGLVPFDRYRLVDGSQSKSLTADPGGTVATPLKLSHGDVVTLSNGSRTLTTLHVANLRVHIVGGGGSVASGTCSPGEYWGGPLTSPPLSAFAGLPTAVAGGAALTGEICPQSGSAAGLPTSSIGQTDERSGGQTVTEVAKIANVSPIEGETMYGKFIALAETTFGPAKVSLTITPAGGGKPVFSSNNVDTANGVNVKALKPGIYKATWVVSNLNGDTRTVTTRFIEEDPSASHSPAPAPKVACHQVTGRHDRKSIRCNVAFAKSAQASGLVRMRITRGSRVAALGSSRLHNGSTTLTMRELRSLNSGTWHITVVYSSGSRRRTAGMRLLVV
jgi:hypothetical protein